MRGEIPSASLRVGRAAGARSLIPQMLHRFHIDPAVSSGTFVTTVTDVVGFFAFLGLATLWFGLR
jgi:magnesium transporter